MPIKKIKILIVFIQIFLVFSCSKDSLIDFMVGSQPNFIGDHTFQPGLNIIGILRPDTINSISTSFVHVEKTVAAVSDQKDSFLVHDARVVIFKMQNNPIIDSFVFSYGNGSGVFKNYEYRLDTFKPLAGERYKLICRAENLPELTSETIIPFIPQLENDTVYTTDTQIKFSIIKDTSAALYDVYYYSENSSIDQRIVPALVGNTQVEFPVNEKPKKIVIFAYDKKMASYLAASNLSFKPNTYRPPFTNVQGGFGSFGSMNIFQKKF